MSCCINATLRDFGRIGLFALRDGKLPDGSAALPEGWIAESTTPSPATAGYGYQWWLAGDGAYRAYGLFGQLVFVDPREQVIIVTQSATDAPWAHRWPFVEALRQRAIASR